MSRSISGSSSDLRAFHPPDDYGLRKHLYYTNILTYGYMYP
jgi:hypothetical protein